MTHRMRAALAALVVLALARVAVAAEIQNGQKIHNLTGGTTSWVDSDSTVWNVSPAHPLPVAGQNLDRDFSAITTLLGPIQEIGPSQSVQMAQAIPLPQYGHNVLLLTYTTQVPADSDSVDVSINVYGTTSGNSANLEFFVPYSDTTGIGLLPPDSSVAGAHPRGVRPSYFVTRNGYGSLSVGKGTVAVSIPTAAYRFASPSGAAIVLSDQNGEAPRFAYILLKVTNNNPRRSIKNVEIDCWPKVN